jgi:UDP-GalNAc:undecaprenyl-phosphate GalNAc-1-phosphate transferase
MNKSSECAHDTHKTNKTRYVITKRVWESVLVIATVGLWLPLAFLVAVFVWLDSTGPIFFLQERVGQGGRVFRMRKFRSMRVESEQAGLRYASQNDDRITRVGKFIRKFRLDELPQLLHVLTGEMALIGVRPEPKQFVDQYAKENPNYMQRHTFKPGITGWAQVEYGYAASGDETMKKLEYDLYYTNNISFKLDILIVYKTIKVILTGFGSR